MEDQKTEGFTDQDFNHLETLVELYKFRYCQVAENNRHMQSKATMAMAVATTGLSFFGASFAPAGCTSITLFIFALIVLAIQGLFTLAIIWSYSAKPPLGKDKDENWDWILVDRVQYFSNMVSTWHNAIAAEKAVANDREPLLAALLGSCWLSPVIMALSKISV